MEHCRRLGVTSPIAIVPNPVEIKDYPYTKTDDIFRLGYLGRLSPRKNIEGLIYAFAELGKEAQQAELLIIGGGDEQYETFLKSEVERLSLKNVRFVGFLSGDEKDKALASCSVLAMPSEFENLGNVILEGLVRGIPCIATTGAPWENLRTHKCGWWVEYN
jgi:glycosyltransferase involved in cell wall biosynthesis